MYVVRSLCCCTFLFKQKQHSSVVTMSNPKYFSILLQFDEISVWQVRHRIEPIKWRASMVTKGGMLYETQRNKLQTHCLRMVAVGPIQQWRTIFLSSKIECFRVFDHCRLRSRFFSSPILSLSRSLSMAVLQLRIVWYRFVHCFLCVFSFLCSVV